MIYKNTLYSTLSGLLLFASCAQTHENAEQVNHLPNMYPDYADVTIPVNIAPLNFEIRNKHLCNIETILTIEGADENDADISIPTSDWKYMIRQAAYMWPTSTTTTSSHHHWQATVAVWRLFPPFRPTANTSTTVQPTRRNCPTRICKI